METYKARRKGEAAPATVNRELACLKTIYNKAIQWGMVATNPVKGVKFLPENNKRMSFLEASTVPALLAACPDYLHPIVVTALNTGMRKGEILELRWDDVDFERRHLRIRRSKNGESRTVEMNSVLHETLLRLKEQSDQPLVFKGRTGKQITTLQKVFRKACTQVGITNFRFHDLRHTFASHLVMNGIDLTTVKELLGHKSIQMTLRYAHLSQQHKRTAVDTLVPMMDGHFLDTSPQEVACAGLGGTAIPPSRKG